MTDLPIRKVLQKPDVVGRMVRWAVKLSEFDVQTNLEALSKAKFMLTSW